MRKLLLQVNRFNEDVISTSSLCQYLTEPGKILASGHIYYDEVLAKGICYYYDSTSGKLKWNGKYNTTISEEGWYHYTGSGYVKCDVGDAGHPHTN